MKKLSEIFDRLGLKENNGLFVVTKNTWKKETTFPNRIKRVFEQGKIKPDAFFCFDNKPLILFFSNPQNKEELHKSIWNFNECPIAIIVENDIVEIFNGFRYETKIKELDIIGGDEELNDFSYFELVTGRTWEKYREQLYYKNRVDYKLLDNIKTARELLCKQNGLRDNAKIINALIGKVIFVRYLIDKEVKISYEGKSRTWSNEEFCSLLNNPKQIRQFFDYLESENTGFNGDLFPLTSNEYGKISSNDYDVIKRLLMGEDLGNGQLSFFQDYDFSIIPIEFISNVYEFFIGQENQRRTGAYYTPLFLVDYILKETVEKKLDNKRMEYDCKVLDPACGSGIFLVETLRKIIEKYIAVSDIKTGKSEKFKAALKKLTKENIYGIDKDPSAVQVAIFSVYLTLLDYLNPPEIETFKFPRLLNTNFFEADFFNEDLPFNNCLKDVEFDFIVGNPPWKGNGMDEMGLRYLKNRKIREKTQSKKFQIAINNKELVEGFVLRTSDFCKTKTQNSLIVRSSILYNLGYNNECSPFRQYLLEEYFIDKVFELAPVRHEVFEKSNQQAIAPAAVLFFRYANGKNTDNNIVEHIALKQNRFFSLFKIFSINKADYKKLYQQKLKEYDWLWKVLLYGSYLDFNFIKRLREHYQTIKEIIYDEERFVVSTGLHRSTEPNAKPANVSLIKDFPFLEAEAITSFFINYKQTQVLESKYIDRVRDPRIYNSPMLLIRKGLSRENLTAKCAISRRNILFTDGITAIKVIKKQDEKVLKSIASICSSSLFAYYAINTFASIGIEREQTQNYNKFGLPFLDLKVSKNVEIIEQAYKKIYSEKQKTLIDEIKIQDLHDVINDELYKINGNIYRKIELTDMESALIDFALEINRNLIVGDEIQKKEILSTLNYKAEILKDYASIFIKRFETKSKSNKKKFVVEIWYTKQIIGMLFKMVPVTKHTRDIVWKDKKNNDSRILSHLVRLSSEKITDKLFVQKDVRGFEKDYFYVFKPNEKRLWHKAIGYLDVIEFADTILREGTKGK